MKARGVILLAATLLVAGAQADFVFKYFSSAGVHDPWGTQGILPNLGDTATVELYYAGANGVADTSLYPGGDDVLLWSAPFVNDEPSSNTDYAVGIYGIDTAPYVGNGLVFGRIQSQETGWYYVGHVQAMADKVIGGLWAPTPDYYNLGLGQPGQLSMIPEPTSTAMIGLVSGLGLFIRRKFMP